MVEHQRSAPRTVKLDELLAKFSPTAPSAALPVIAKRLRLLNRELCEQTFCHKYVESGFNAIDAYRALRPDASKNAAMIGAARWLSRPKVKAYVQWLTQEGLRNARIGIEYVLAQAKSMAESNMFDFLTVNEHGDVRLHIDPTNLTLAQQLNLRGIKFDAETGGVTEVKLPDREKANSQILDCLKVMAEVSDAAGSVASELQKRLDRAAKHKRMTSLPPPVNVTPTRLKD